MKRRGVLMLWLGLAATACNQRAIDAATGFCQRSMDEAHVPPERLAASCDSCCHQDVTNRGQIEGGRCVCH